MQVSTRPIEQLAPAPVLPESMPIEREAELRQVFPPHDFADAYERGWFDQFHYDQATGEDALMHMLVGEIKMGENGTNYVTGFHHEPSGRTAWPSILQEDGTARPTTYVDRGHLEGASERTLTRYTEHPFEPHYGKVVIDGYRKFIIQRGPEGAEKKLTEARNNMYPKEYDAYMVTKAAIEARDNRDVALDNLQEPPGRRRVIKADGTVPMIDGKTPMKIRMILDADTNKIISAWPVIPNKPGLMELTEKEAKKYASGLH